MRTIWQKAATNFALHFARLVLHQYLTNVTEVDGKNMSRGT
jgi:hypothetical protein